MATTLKDCEVMIKASEESGQILQIGLEMRYTEIYQKMKEIISDYTPPEGEVLDRKREVQSREYPIEGEDSLPGVSENC